ncbi:MAG: hypothetical protein SFV23_15485 [Planctomycetaceae bacterium]|nr:hypothetical protein [Planctomycetaceae bacterium]
MNSFDWAIIQLLLLFWGFVFFVLFMVLAPMVLISAKLKKDRKKGEQAVASKTPASPSAASAVVVSPEDGRVIAMEAPDQEPVSAIADQPPKNGLNLVKDVLLPVAGKAVVAIAAHQFKHRHHK